jgi:hypothetical protein
MKCKNLRRTVHFPLRPRVLNHEEGRRWVDDGVWEMLARWDAMEGLREDDGVRMRCTTVTSEHFKVMTWQHNMLAGWLAGAY